jgi:Na+/melibiose symporter-like transporter
MGKTVAGIAAFLWLVIYTNGIVISTAPYRQSLNDSTIDAYQKLCCWVIVFFCYTMTNIPILCCLSAIMGGYCQRTTGTVIEYAGRGLFVYFVLVSGILLVGNNPFDNPSQGQYTRLASTASLIAFIAGYSPELFERMASAVKEIAGKK